MARKQAVDPKKVRGISVLVACDVCQERGRLPGGLYKSQGEVVDCPCCSGRRVVSEMITLSMLGKLMDGEKRRG